MKIYCPEDAFTKLPPVDTMQHSLLSAKEVVVCDIETTGLSPSKYAEIIEVGAVKIDMQTRKVVGMFSTIISPVKMVINTKITELTGITQEMTRGKPYIEDVIPQFYNFIGDAVIVAHNASFDWNRFLQPIMLQGGRIVNNDVVCTMALSKKLFPHEKKHNLAALCERYGHKIEGHHRALTDAKYTASILLRMVDEINAGDTKQHTHPKSVPLKIPFSNTDNFSIISAKPYSYPSKTQGDCIFFNTNYGQVYFNATRMKIGFQKMTIPMNVDLSTIKLLICQKFRTDSAGLWDAVLDQNPWFQSKYA